MSILITGGTGGIGVGLAHELVAKDEDVVLFDIAPQTGRLAEIKDRVKIVPGDLKVWPEVMNVVKENNVKGIFHHGSMLSLPSEANPWAAYNTNANGTYHILEAARLFDVKSVIFPSGIATYSPPLPDVINEDVFQSAPKQMYGITKIFCERMGEYYHQKFGINFRCVSLPAICGPGRREGLAAYASLMVHEPAKGRPCRLPIDENVQMPFIYIKDVLRCLKLIAEADDASLRRRVYSIQGFSLPAKEMAETVKKHIPDAKVKFLADPNIVRLATDMPKSVDDSRAREDWGWQPDYNWKNAVKDFIAEISNNPEKYT